jgi:hypothetical protein
MPNVMLYAFFQALKAEHVEVGIRDVGRIQTVFSARRQWTLPAIRDSLRALLAHEPSQRSTFDRVFRQFFRDSASGEPIEPMDLVRALQEFRDLRPAVHLPHPPPPNSDASDLVAAPSHNPRWERLGPALGIVGQVVLLGITIVISNPSVSPSSDPLSIVNIEPATLDFGTHEIGVKSQATLMLVNRSTTETAQITSLAIAGDYRDFVASDLDALLNRTLAPGEKVSLRVSFTPQDAGDRRGAVVVNAAKQWPPVQAPLKGSGTKTTGDVPPADIKFPPFIYRAVDANGLPNSIRHQFEPLIYSRAWRYWFAASGLCFLLMVALGIYVYFWRKLPRDEAPPWRENEPGERFSFASVGGQPAPILYARQAKRLGDMLDFIRTETLSPRLDPQRTVRATIRAGGIPNLRYLPYVALRSVVVLEDVWTHRDFRSPIIDQLCDGLLDTGVALARYKFRGAVDPLLDQRGAMIDLAELARERDMQAVLLFTDGASFAHPQAGRMDGAAGRAVPCFQRQRTARSGPARV